MSDAPDAEDYDLATRDHDEIRRWIDERDGYPAEGEDEDEGDGDGGAADVRIAREGDEGGTRLDWEEFFERLDANDLAVAYRVAADEDAAASARVVPADEVDLTDAESGADAAAEAEHETPRDPDPSETIDDHSEMRSSEAADEANLDNHRDEPPYES